MTRPHDLPPLWDGHRVEWFGPWRQIETSARFHLPLKDQACRHACGSLATPLSCRGVVHDGNPEGPRQLSVARCPDCHHDTVYDLETGEFWDLDDSDYGPEGSYDEATHQGVLF